MRINKNKLCDVDNFYLVHDGNIFSWFTFDLFSSNITKIAEMLYSLLNGNTEYHLIIYCTGTNCKKKNKESGTNLKCTQNHNRRHLNSYQTILPR